MRCHDGGPGFTEDELEGIEKDCRTGDETMDWSQAATHWPKLVAAVRGLMSEKAAITLAYESCEQRLWAVQAERDRLVAAFENLQAAVARNAP